MIRKAKINEYRILTEISFNSKGYWNYPEEYSITMHSAGQDHFHELIIETKCASLSTKRFIYLCTHCRAQVVICKYVLIAE